MIDLEAIKTRCDAATAGPWEVENGDVVSVGNDGTRVVEGLQRHWTAMMSQLGRSKSMSVCWEYSVRDIDFIAHARQDIPALLSEVSALRERVGVLEGAALQVATLLDGMVLSGKLDQHECRNTFQRLKKALALREAKEK